MSSEFLFLSAVSEIPSSNKGFIIFAVYISYNPFLAPPNIDMFFIVKLCKSKE